MFSDWEHTTEGSGAASCSSRHTAVWRLRKRTFFFELLRVFFQRFFHVEICFFPRNWLSGRHSRSDQYLWCRWSLASWSVWKRNCERGRCFPCFPESFSLYCCCSNFNELWYTWPVDWVLVANERNRAGTFGFYIMLEKATTRLWG